MIRVALIDDHVIVRAGFRALLESQTDLNVVAEGATVEEGIALLDALSIDVLVLDITMRNESGLALLEHATRHHPQVGCLMMSMHEGMTYVHEALRRGALGYVTKAAAPDELARGIRAVAAGQSFLSSDLALEVPGPNHAGLTPREIEVLVLLAKGRQPKQVAADLRISTKTAYVHRSHLLEKLGLRSDLELYRFALAAGLLSLDTRHD